MRFHSGFIRRLSHVNGAKLAKPLALQKRLRPRNRRTALAKAIRYEQTHRSAFWYAPWRAKEHNRMFRGIKPGDAAPRPVTSASSSGMCGRSSS